MGHLEHGCSRDDLKNKFMCYGEIKNITFHFKTEQNDTKLENIVTIIGSIVIYF